MNPLKVIIAGGRTFNDWDMFKSFCDKILINQPNDKIIIFSGGATGADALAKYYAELRNVPFHEFPADWDGLGKSAGPIRNSLMAEKADALIAFWDGKSRGTKDMIYKAQQRMLRIRIKRYE